MKRTLQEGFKKKKKKKEKKRKEKKTLFATLLTVLRQTTTKDEAIHLLTARLTNKTSQRGVERGVGFTARVTTFPRASNIFLVGPVVRPPLARKRAIPQSDTRVHTPSPPRAACKEGSRRKWRFPTDFRPRPRRIFLPRDRSRGAMQRGVEAVETFSRTAAIVPANLDGGQVS